MLKSPNKTIKAPLFEIALIAIFKVLKEDVNPYALWSPIQTNHSNIQIYQPNGVHLTIQSRVGSCRNLLF